MALVVACASSRPSSWVAEAERASSRIHALPLPTSPATAGNLLEEALEQVEVIDHRIRGVLDSRDDILAARILKARGDAMVGMVRLIEATPLPATLRGKPPVEAAFRTALRERSSKFITAARTSYTKALGYAKTAKDRDTVKAIATSLEGI